MSKFDECEPSRQELLNKIHSLSMLLGVVSAIAGFLLFLCIVLFLQLQDAVEVHTALSERYQILLLQNPSK